MATVMHEINRDQVLGALAMANDVRVSNANAFKAIKAMAPAAGCEMVATILRDPQGTEPAMRVGLLLRAIRGVGPVKVKALLRSLPSTTPYPAAIGGDTRIGALVPRQREALATMLDLRAPTMRTQL